MKIILSRKGFDSENGGIASPIMEDGKLLSLPIPVTKKQAENGEKGISYDELTFGDQKLNEIIDELSKGKFDTDLQAHLDPDLEQKRYPRKEGWKQVFGQTNGAQTYLDNKNVGLNDLFLFFGWFQHTKKEKGRLRYLKPSEDVKDLHLIFGWLQIGEILKNNNEIHPWLEYHPHIVNKADVYTGNNTIYIASDALRIFGETIFGKNGGGTFPTIKKSLQLTAENESMSHWSLPKWLLEGAWECRDGHLPFLSGGRKQEFVFDVPDKFKKEAIDWLKSLFEDC